MKHIVIIGNGIAGITAARNIRKLSDHKITVISGESDHFFSRTALMYIYMGHMQYEHTKPYEDWFWGKNRIELIRAWVNAIDFDSKKLFFDDPELNVEYDQLILATGSQSNVPDWPGRDLKGVQGLYSLQDLELMEENTKGISGAVIVGGGLIGVEMSEMLHSRGIHVTYLVQEKHFWGNVLSEEEGALIDDHLHEYGIDLRLETELREIIGGENGRIKGVKTKSGEVIECQFVGLTVGVHPNIGLVKGTRLDADIGILVDEYLQTNITDVYAIGDCVQVKAPLAHRKGVEAVWYVGRIMGETVAHTLTGSKIRYEPGVWFNSAKFFDMEYQNYGTVPPVCPQGHGQFYWESRDKHKCIRIIYEKASKKVGGVNLLGIRNRHDVWDKWLKNGQTLEYVIQHLPKANFDPEFSEQWEREAQKKYNEEYPEQPVIVRKKRLIEKIFA